MADDDASPSPTEIDMHSAIQIEPAQKSAGVESSADAGSAEAQAAEPKEEVASTRGTSVNLLVSGLIGLGVTILFFGLLYVALSDETWFYLLFWRDPSIPFFATLLFFWAIAILCMKIRHIRRESRAFDLDLLPQDPYQLITIRDVQAILREINRMAPEQQNLFLVTRVARALRRVRASGNSAEIDGLLEYQGSIDSAAVESTYAAVKIFIWAIPVVGFIGTVLGISVAIGNFGDLVQRAGDVEQIKAGLGGVTGGLSVAFETTLLALVFSIIVMFYSTYIRKREDDLLTSVEDHCVEHLVNKLAIGDDKLVAQLNEAFSEAQEDAARRQAEVVEGALVELQERQTEALQKLNEFLNQQQNQSLESLVNTLGELFDDATGQQGTRLSEMSQRIERGLRSLGDNIQEMGKSLPAADGSLASGQGSDFDPDKAERLIGAMERQAQQLLETRKSLETLSQSLQHLATLEPFHEVMGNIQKALDTLIPAIDELRKPRELRIIDSVQPQQAADDTP